MVSISTNKSERLTTLLRSIKKSQLSWRYGYNLRPTLAYNFADFSRPRGHEKQVVRSLSEDGICVTNIADLLPDASVYSALTTGVEELLRSNKNSIERMKTDVDQETAIGKKTFNLEMLGSDLTFDPSNIFARFALQPSFLRIANAYLGMQAKLRYYNVWYTTASTSAARESQLWHFDREDRYILKVFLYLDDVTEGGGPFTYALGTHKKGRHRSIEPDFFVEGGVRRTNDAQMEAVFPKVKWRTGTGPKGTIILADTRGYHKGGEARTKDRLMFTCMYTSPASESKNLVTFPEELDYSQLSPAQLRAIGR